MTKWEYGVANYDGTAIDTHIGYMTDVTDASGDIMEFLRQAGQRGWELCGILPAPTLKPNLGAPKTLGLVFKRPAEQEEYDLFSGPELGWKDTDER